MSNVSTKYSTAANSNAKLGSISLKENETRYRDLNDLFRLLMADARQESNEVRSLIKTATSNAATANSAAITARGEASEAKAVANNYASQISQLQSTASQAVSAAGAAGDLAEQAMQATAGIQAVATQASQNANAIGELSSRVLSLEEASAHDAALVTVDGVTMDNTGGVLKAIDVEVGDNDLASARGQLGRTAITSAESLDGLVQDGWYAFGSGTSGKPEGIVEGVVRVSSSHTSGTTFQSVFAAGSETARVFWRSSTDGANWTAWSEPIASGAIGDGLSYEDGVLDVVFPDVLPTTEGTDPSYVLTAGGTWDQRATPEQISQLASGLAELESGLATLQERVDGYVAVSAIEPDGTTVAIVDGQYSVPLYFGASATEDGIAGLVPPAEAGDLLFLRSDGQWADPVLASVPTFDGSTEGTVPVPAEDEDGFFLRSDGQWADPLEDLEPRVQALENLDVAGFSERIGDLELDAQNVASTEDIDSIFAEPESMGG